MSVAACCCCRLKTLKTSRRAESSRSVRGALKRAIALRSKVAGSTCLPHPYNLRMDFDPFNHAAQLHALFQQVEIRRRVEYHLFTFGDSDLEYYLVEDGEEPGELVSVTRGEVGVTRPTILRPDSRPELFGFFEELNEQLGGLGGEIEFLMSRTAAFRDLKIENRQGESQIVSDSVEEAVAKLEKKLDNEEEDRVAILVAPHGLGPIAVFRYATERISVSAPGNIQELRERGFLPG